MKSKVTDKQILDAHGQSYRLMQEGKRHDDEIKEPTKSLELWAIIDISKKDNPRFCYADGKKTKGAMAVYDKKPVIEPHWKPFKKAVRVTLKIINQ